MRNPYEKLWKDTMDIYRWSEVTNDDGTTGNVLPDEPTYSGVKCHYSMKNISALGVNGAPIIVSDDKLFCASDVDIREGDVAIVTQRNGRTINLIVGAGFPYTQNQEFSVRRNEMV